MIPKPSACDTCPLAKYGSYFTPDTMIPGSKVLFYAQNPGEAEEQGRKLVKRHFGPGGRYEDEYELVTPQPLIGATGQLFDRRFLPLTGLKREEISLGNAIRCRPGKALGLEPNGLPPISSAMKLESSDALIVKALKHCRDAYLRIPESVDTIVTMGRHAMFSLTGIQNEESEYGKKQGVVESWRGYSVDGYWDSNNKYPHRTVDTTHYHTLESNQRILFTMHLAALFKGDTNEGEGRGNKRFWNATLQDFHKVKLLLNRTWPGSLPSWSNTPPTTWPKYAAFDTEYIPSPHGHNDQLIRWSLCDTDGMLYCIDYDPGNPLSNKIPIQPGSTVIIQNALADISHLAGLVDMSHVRIEDLMLAHTVLYTGEPHNLNFIQSKYGVLNRYKHLSKENPRLYSAMDAYIPMQMWMSHFLPMFKDDLLSWKVYRNYRIPRIWTIDKAQRTGARIDQSKVLKVKEILEERLARYQARAREVTGDPTFNLGGSKKMKELVYG